MHRVIIYAVGRVFEAEKNSIDWNCVIAVCDKKVSSKKRIHGKPLIRPEEILQYDFDYIAVFSNKLFEEIRLYLALEIGIPQEYIFSWRVFLNKLSVNPYYQIHQIRDYIYKNDVKRILLSRFIVDKENVFLKKDMDETGSLSVDALNCVGLENSPFDFQIVSSANSGDYSIVIHFIRKKAEYNELPDLLSYVKTPGGRLLLVNQCTCDFYSSALRIKSLFAENGHIRHLYRNGQIITELTPIKAGEKDAISIYVVKHKEFFELRERPYRTICVGGYCENDRYSLSDDIGDNIAELNNKINECTALYWLWKHSKDEIIGINHYRRYFANSEMPYKNNFLQVDKMRMYLSTHDVILAERVFFDFSVREFLESSMDQMAFHKAEILVEKSICKHQPDYMETYKSIMNGGAIFPANMIITSKKLFDDYCEWLFSIILEPAREFDASSYDAYSARAVGFFAERLLTVWIVRQGLRIKELPVIYAKG